MYVRRHVRVVAAWMLLTSAASSMAQGNELPCTTGKPALPPQRRLLCNPQRLEGSLQVTVRDEAERPQSGAVVSFVDPLRGNVLWSRTSGTDGSIRVPIRRAELGFLVVGAKYWASQAFPESGAPGCAVEIQVTLSREEEGVPVVTR